ncbi:MAG: hypothetical protein IZT59_12760 [Verrucomicrobia bacterium]|nr:hypothetical protein [Verrucomicrobiota bacterium]|tara:strand:- start:42482 stop:43234 length:753 start_codon:yes stop_codon:yes gene_type:complete
MIRSYALLALPLLSLVSCGVTSGGGAPGLPPRKAPPDIFDSYYPDRDANMADGWTRGMDMSGVSFNDTRTATLITPRHVVMAKHYSRPAGAPVVFHDRGGNRIKRKIIGFAPASGDVMVALLDEPVPSNYRSYPLPSTSTNSAAIIGRHAIISDQNRKLFVHLVAGIERGIIGFKQDESDTHGWGKNLVVGDSGNPAFLIAGNQLVLVETHTNGGSGSGPYYGDPTVQASIRAAVAKLDGSYRIHTVMVR